MVGLPPTTLVVTCQWSACTGGFGVGRGADSEVIVGCEEETNVQILTSDERLGEVTNLCLRF